MNDPDTENPNHEERTMSRVVCTCCDGNPDFQKEDEDARPTTVPAGASNRTIVQVMCAACAMMCGGTKEDYEAAGFEVISMVEPREETPC